MRRATTNQSSGVPDDRRRKTFDEHVDVMLVHFKEQLLRAHEREMGWFLGSGGSSAGSKKPTREQEFMSPILTSSLALSDGPWSRATLPGQSTLQPKPPKCSGEAAVERVTSTSSYVSSRASRRSRVRAIAALGEQGSDEVVQAAARAVAASQLRTSSTASSMVSQGTVTTLSETTANRVVLNWADITTRLLMDSDVPMFNLHPRWNSTASSTLTPRELRDYDGDNMRASRSLASASMDYEPNPQSEGPSDRRKLCSIHPHSNARLAWTVLTFLAWTFEFVTVPLELSSEISIYNRPLLAWCLMFIWTLDIFLSFRTGVYVEGRLHMDFRTIAREYAKSWLLLDLSVVIVEYVAVITQQITPSTVSLLRSFRFFRLVKMLRFKRLHSMLNEILFERAKVLTVNISVFKTCLAYLAGLHMLACFWLFLRTSTSTGREHFAEHGVVLGEMSDTTHAYLISIHWALDFLLWCEIDLIESQTDQVIAALARLIGFVGTSIFLARIAFLVQQYVDSRLNNLQDVCSHFLETHSISTDLSVRMKKFVISCYQQSWLESKLQEELALFSKMPKSLQTDLYEESRGPFLVKSAFLLEYQERFRPCFRHICCEGLVEVVAQRQEVIFSNGHHSTSMLCLVSGMYSYKLARKHTLLGHLGQLLAPRTLRARSTPVGPARAICEIALWTNWLHTGTLQVLQSGYYYTVSADVLGNILAAYPEAHRTAVAYGRLVVIQLHHVRNDCTDLTPLEIDFSQLRKVTARFLTSGHMIFLSHFKKEAGTEAALMQDALMNKIQTDPHHPAHYLEHPVFLDSENLEDLTKLRDHIQKSKNMVILLTPGIFERPWCLVEMVSAFKQGKNIVPVEIQKPDMKFEYPDEDFLADLSYGAFFSETDMQIFAVEQIELSEIEAATRHILTKISVTFSPHKASSIRDVEIRAILQRRSVHLFLFFTDEHDLSSRCPERSSTAQATMALKISTGSAQLPELPGQTDRCPQGGVAAPIRPMLQKELGQPQYLASPRSAAQALRELARQKRWSQAIEVFHAMQETAIEANVFHLSSVMSACEKASAWQHALGMFFGCSASVDLDTVCFNAAISACGRCVQWPTALQLLDMLSANSQPNTVSYNSTISVCGKSSCWARALWTFTSMRGARIDQDQISHNAVISAGEWDRALMLLTSMSQHQLAPDVVSYGATISACEKGGQWQAALAVLQSLLEDRLAPSDICWNAAISACEKCGQWQGALLLLESMPSSGVTPDVVSFNAAISACAKGGRWEQALALLHSATRAEVITFNAAISACEKAGRWQHALALLAVMPEKSIRRDVITYNSVMAALKNAGQWETTMQLMQLMCAAGMPLRTSTYVMSIDACGKASLWQLAVDMISDMFLRSLPADDFCFHAAISACEQGGFWQQALGLVADMQLRKLNADGICWGSVLHAMKLAGREDLAQKTLERLRQRWAQPSARQVAGPIGTSMKKLAPDVVIGDGVLAVFKPAGCTSESMLERLLAKWRAGGWQGELTLVSRLDLPTSGVLPLALGGQADGPTQYLDAQYAARQVSKEYLCLAAGQSLGPRGARASIDTPLLVSRSWGERLGKRVEASAAGKQAQTKLRILELFDIPPELGGVEALALLAVRPMTGRLHQIRVHLASLGSPIVGDNAYGGCSLAGSRLFLHCRSVSLKDLSGSPFKPKYPLPEDLQRVLADLRPQSKDLEERSARPCVSQHSVRQPNTPGSRPNSAGDATPSRSGTMKRNNSMTRLPDEAPIVAEKGYCPDSP
ncbi:unnamed protein product, partial [Symbiodinium microadriaticum]